MDRKGITIQWTSLNADHTQPFNGPLAGTTRASQYQKKTFTHSYQWGRRRIRTDKCLGARPLYGALIQRGWLDPVKPAYNQSRPDGRLKLTASSFNLLRISMSAGLVTVPTVTQNSLTSSFINFVHYCSPSSGLYGAAKDNRGRCIDNLTGRHPIQSTNALTSIISPSF